MSKPPYNQLSELATKLNDLKTQGRVSYLSGSWKIEEDGVKININLVAHSVLKQINVFISNEEIDSITEKVMARIMDAIKT